MRTTPVKIFTATACALVSVVAPPSAGVAQTATAEPTEGARIVKDQAYVPGGHERQKLDLYLPADGRDWPLIVWIHGGAWRGENKERPPAVRFLRDGYAVASINYRLSQHATFPAQIEDCKASIRWLRAHADEYGYDANRIGVWGASAGGHLVALLGTAGDVKEFDVGEHLDVSSRVRVVVDFFGPTDFLQMNEQAGAGGRMDHDAADSPESRLIGGPIQEHEGKVARANPITYVSADDPPFLIMHGEDDFTVAIGQSELLHEALEEAGVSSTFECIPDTGHGFGGPGIDRSVLAFLDRHLKGISDEHQREAEPGDVQERAPEEQRGEPRKSGQRDQDTAEHRLSEYRAELAEFRNEFGGTRELPEVPFFLFGMGPRTKLLYKDGALTDVASGETVERWNVEKEIILPPDYAVVIDTIDGGRIRVVEDEQGVWVEQSENRRAVAGTDKPVRLPAFADCRYPQVLRVLHQELLVNVIDGNPVPNHFVYPKPWYRDGAMMALCFEATGNLEVIRDWVLGLREPYDRNNNGETEADNLGQALYLISLFSDRNHPLVAKVLEEFPRFEVDGPDGKYIKGRSDFAEHPAYQTKWAKYGLEALGLADPYVVPHVQDSYSALFWMDYKDTYVRGKDADNKGPYPYLGWACDHFHGTKTSPISNRDYPLTWEQRASQADYEGMKIVSEEYTDERLAAPHTWHAAEVFLYLLDRNRDSETSTKGK
jgi:acetyl esterase/lipase